MMLMLLLLLTASHLASKFNATTAVAVAATVPAAAACLPAIVFNAIIVAHLPRLRIGAAAAAAVVTVAAVTDVATVTGHPLLVSSATFCLCCITWLFIGFSCI